VEERLTAVGSLRSPASLVASRLWGAFAAACLTSALLWVPVGRVANWAFGMSWWLGIAPLLAFAVLRAVTKRLRRLAPKSVSVSLRLLVSVMTSAGLLTWMWAGLYFGEPFRAGVVPNLIFPGIAAVAPLAAQHLSVPAAIPSTLRTVARFIAAGALVAAALGLTLGFGSLRYAIDPVLGNQAVMLITVYGASTIIRKRANR
jgi:hypothetical protein